MVLLKAQKTFSIRSLFGNWALFPNFSSKTHRTCLTHHISIYLGLSGLKLNITRYYWTNPRAFLYRQTTNIFMEGSNCWPMQIYCYIFVIIVEKETQIFYNILYMCLKRIIFLFKTPANPFFPCFLIIRERTFYLEFVIMWEAFFEIP